MFEFLTEPLVIGTLNLPFSLLELFLRFVLPVAGFLIATRLLTVLTAWILRKTKLSEEKAANALRWIRRILRLLFVIAVVLALVSLLGARAFSAFGRFLRALNTPFFSSGNTKISVVTLLLLIPVFALASWTGRAVRGLIENRVFRKIGLDEEKAFSFGRLTRYLVMTLVFIFGLSIIGIDLSALGVLFGVLGIGIGFGLQGVVSDFFSGLTLVGMGIIKEGDRIRVTNHDGIVKRIRLLNTELDTFENESLVVPNSMLTRDVVHNYSYRDKRVVIVNNVEVAYETDLDLAIQILQDIAERNPWRDTTETILVRVVSFNSSGIALSLRTWIDTYRNRPEAMSWTNLEIWRDFKKRGIVIPFPQRDVHLKNPTPPPGLSADPERN